MKYVLRGFTLVELMVTLAVALALLGIAVPAYRQLVESNARAAAISDLTSSLALARSEAVNRAATISLCPSSNGTACEAVPWTSGWLMFLNADAETPPAVDAGEAVLKVAQANSVVTVNPSASFSQGLSFGARGTASTTGDFVFCGKVNGVTTPLAKRSVSILGIVTREDLVSGDGCG